MTYKHTMAACCLGYMTQAVMINLPTILFLFYSRLFNITPVEITMLIIFNFTVQLAVDALSIKLTDIIGYRRGAITAAFCSFLGLILLTLLPTHLPSPFAGLLIATFVGAIGAGLIEVVVSPIVEAIPEGGRQSAMSLLHSFYSWGHVLVIALSTLLFRFVNPLFLPAIWSALPLFTMVLFALVPICEIKTEGTKRAPSDMGALALFVVMMICAGAAEQAINQWSSYFAESALSLTKSVGDLLGPCMFALLMGAARLLFSLFGTRFDLRRTVRISSLCCFLSYILAALSPSGIVSLTGCALCGLFVGILWPCTLSLAAKEYNGGAAMFALLSLGGDIGCIAGPAIVGQVYSAIGGTAALRAGILTGALFPLILILVLGKRRV